MSTNLASKRPRASESALSLHAVLKEAEDAVLAQPLSPIMQERLNGCHHALKDLDDLLQKYEGVGTMTRRTWDRIRWGAEDVGHVAELRARLISNTVLLTALIRCVHEFPGDVLLISNLLAHLKPILKKSSMTF
jgi:hypothetical protein